MGQALIDEEKRLALQTVLDGAKTQSQRNRLGQFATPTALAQEVLEYGIRLLPPATSIRFLDPAIGTGSFYSALRAAVSENFIEMAEGFEIDPHYGLPSQNLWADTPLKVHLTDFTKIKPSAIPQKRFNLVICNPPYVRHHHIPNEDKLRLQAVAEQVVGMPISGLAGLYCYFLALAHSWMAEDGIGGWLIPSEFMDVNYGMAVKHYLLNQVTLLRVHRFNPKEVQFADALVSSAIVWFRKAKPLVDYSVEFTFGGTLTQPALTRMINRDALRQESKWTRFPVSAVREVGQGVKLADFFTIKRGIATGDNHFFILTKQQIQVHDLPMACFRPILPGPRHLIQNEVLADAAGNPLLTQQLFLLDCRLPEDEIKMKYPTLWQYLEGGIPTVSERYLCRHRKPWYSQEDRPPAPFICTYIVRSDAKSGRPFRFILNQSCATAANVYLLLYPKPVLAAELARNPQLARQIWQIFNEINPEIFLEGGRVYGGGLHKLEPNELANISAEQFLPLMPQAKHQIAHQLELFSP